MFTFLFSSYHNDLYGWPPIKVTQVSPTVFKLGSHQNTNKNCVIMSIENSKWKVTNLSFLLEMNEQHVKRECAFAEKRDHAIFVQPESLIYEHMLRCLIWAPCINNSYLTCDRTLSFIYIRNTSSSQWKENAKITHISSLIIRVSKFSSCYFTYI